MMLPTPYSPEPPLVIDAQLLVILVAFFGALFLIRMFIDRLNRRV